MPDAMVSAQVGRADFAFFVDFKRGEGPASRVFLAIREFVEACERLDRELVASIDGSIQAITVLEDVEAGSVKAFFRGVLRSTDDQALKSLDWKGVVGGYLVHVKRMLLEWLETGIDKREDLRNVRRRIQERASNTDVRHIPHYSPVKVRTLLDAATDFDRIKSHLLEGDLASFVDSGGQIKLNIENRLDIDSVEEEVAGGKQIRRLQMILMVKRPDYLGSSMWDMKHDNRSLSVRIEDEKWLTRFQGRGVDVRPGDALKCRVRIELLYVRDPDRELLEEKHYIEEVHGVVADRYKQSKLDL